VLDGADPCCSVVFQSLHFVIFYGSKFKHRLYAVLLGEVQPPAPHAGNLHN